MTDRLAPRRARRHSVRGLMKIRVTTQPDWSKVGEHAHLVQFYEDESVLIPQLGRYIGTALVAGDAAIVVSTEPIRHQVAAHLAGRGLDVAVARSQGRYFDADAATMLRQIMRAGMPDAGRFERLAGRLIDRATAGGRRVAVFGMMVHVLCGRGRIDAAIRLDELWNQLARQRALTLACAYRMSRFSNTRDAAPFVRICSQHSHVFSASR